MTEINIYKLLDQHFPKTFPKLLEALIRNGHKIKILCKDEQKIQNLDASLWSFASLAFIPHATENDDYLDEQPILLTTKHEFNPNNSDVLILFDNFLNTEEIHNYQKIMLILTQHSKFNFDDFSNDIEKKKSLSYQLITQISESKWTKEKHSP